MDTDTVSITALHSLDAFRACEDLQYAVWRLDDREIVPDHIFLTSVRYGGLVLGAFAPEGTMVGMLFGFPGTGDAAHGVDHLHCSHIMGVLPRWQGKGVGYQLKCAQRAWALRQGLRLVVWTYDPLESRNAALNIAKLGAICRRYVRNLYGAMRDALNAGLPSDRFEVEWWIDSDAVQRRLSEGKLAAAEVMNARRANSVHWRADGLPVPEAEGIAWGGAPALLEIPADFQRIRRSDPALARTWRLHFRTQCEAAFAAGYTVIDFTSWVDEDGVRRSFYRLAVIPHPATPAPDPPLRAALP